MTFEERQWFIEKSMKLFGTRYKWKRILDAGLKEYQTKNGIRYRVDTPLKLEELREYLIELEEEYDKSKREAKEREESLKKEKEEKNNTETIQES